MAEDDSYGIHLTLRVGDVERRAALDDPPTVVRFLESLVDRIGMSILAGPVVGVEPGAPDRSGVSGVVILRESHAAVHTYPGLGQAFLDVFSCRPFATEVVTAVVGDFFGAHRVVEVDVLTRGRHWTVDVERELRSWHTAR